MTGEGRALRLQVPDELVPPELRHLPRPTLTWEAPGPPRVPVGVDPAVVPAGVEFEWAGPVS